mgnify:FL=1
MPNVVYTAHSKLTFYARDIICEHAMQQGAVPLNPFRMFGYFLSDRVDRDLVREANNRIVGIADETWVYGGVSNGVWHEIVLAHRLGKPVRYWTVATWAADIKPTTALDVEVEDQLCAELGTDADGVRERLLGLGGSDE